MYQKEKEDLQEREIKARGILKVMDSKRILASQERKDASNHPEKLVGKADASFLQQRGKEGSVGIRKLNDLYNEKRRSDGRNQNQAVENHPSSFTERDQLPLRKDADRGQSSHHKHVESGAIEETHFPHSDYKSKMMENSAHRESIFHHGTKNSFAELKSEQLKEEPAFSTEVVMIVGIVAGLVAVGLIILISWGIYKYQIYKKQKAKHARNQFSGYDLMKEGTKNEGNQGDEKTGKQSQETSDSSNSSPTSSSSPPSASSSSSTSLPSSSSSSSSATSLE